MTHVFQGQPDKPSTADWEAHQRVQHYFAWAEHAIAVAHGRWEMVCTSGEAPYLKTSAGITYLDDLDDEQMSFLGINPVRDESDKIVGWEW